LDEIDWEIIGSQTTQAQSNYFGKGNTTTYDRGEFHAVTEPQTEIHTYAVDWRPNNTTWLIDGKVVRTLLFDDAIGGKNYPQTPMNIRMGNWVAGNPSNAQGTIQWAGGLADLSKAPFTMTIESIKIINYFPAVAYSYGDNSGSWQSIKLWNTTSSSSEPSSSAEPSVTSSLNQLQATAPSNSSNVGTTVTINALPATVSSVVNAGIVVTGSFSGSAQPVYTILVGGANGTAASQTPSTTTAGSTMTTAISQPLSGSKSASAAPAMQTTNAAVSISEGGMSKFALAVFGGCALMFGL
jgi:beta-glucanase (GH16 family)